MEELRGIAQVPILSVSDLQEVMEASVEAERCTHLGVRHECGGVIAAVLQSTGQGRRCLGESGAFLGDAVSVGPLSREEGSH